MFNAVISEPSSWNFQPLLLIIPSTWNPEKTSNPDCLYKWYEFLCFPLFFWEWCWFHKIPSFEVQMMPQNNAMHQGPVTMDPWVKTAGFWLRNGRSPWKIHGWKMAPKKNSTNFLNDLKRVWHVFSYYSHTFIFGQIIGNKLPVGNGGLAKEHLPKWPWFRLRKYSNLPITYLYTYKIHVWINIYPNHIRI